MNIYRNKYAKKIATFLASFLLLALLAGHVAYAEIVINILAVNGTDQEKEKEVSYSLPKELAYEDILDTAGLELEYDINQASYVVKGKHLLAPKETKTFKVRVKDVWLVTQEDVDGIAEQIEISEGRIKDTEFAEVGRVKKNILIERLDFILGEQERFSDSVGKRIDRFRIYEKEMAKIRQDAVSITYWRTKLAKDSENIVKFFIEVENPSAKDRKTVSQSHYLPREVKPEHFIELEGFEFKFDSEKNLAYLLKEEELKPLEKKKYEFSIVDIWRILQQDIDNLKDRTRTAFKLIEKTEYVESAEYLVKSIKENLEKIEASQEVERPIAEHISAYRINQKRYAKALTDVKALEDLLMAIREELERSRLKNVLQKIKSLKSISDIAEAIIGTKPSVSDAWKIIIGIISFVGLVTIIHFSVWGKRSRSVKIEGKSEEDEEEAEETPKE